MKFLLSSVLLSASLAMSAFAGQLEYDLKVEGMKCAYCAYNVSKQLEAIDGVVSKSVDVDLDQGRVTLRSETELVDAQLADVLLQAGFNLATVAKAEVTTAQREQRADETVLLSVTMNSDRIGSGEFDAVLEGVGDIAAERSGRITVVAPGELETAILRPVLAGRQTVIKVDYKPVDRPDHAVVVSVSANPVETR